MKNMNEWIENMNERHGNGGTGFSGVISPIEFHLDGGIEMISRAKW